MNLTAYHLRAKEAFIALREYDLGSAFGRIDYIVEGAREEFLARVNETHIRECTP